MFVFETIYSVMLPVHVFAEAVGFLHLYDLDALLLTNARCSELALAAAEKIRVFDFTDFWLGLYTSEFRLINMTAGGGVVTRANHTRLDFINEAELVEFVPRALRNCAVCILNLDHVFGDFRMRFVVEAIMEVAHTIVISGALCVSAEGFRDVRDLVDVVGSFRRVKVRCSQINLFPITLLSEPFCQ